MIPDPAAGLGTIVIHLPNESAQGEAMARGVRACLPLVLGLMLLQALVCTADDSPDRAGPLGVARQYEEKTGKADAEAANTYLEKGKRQWEAIYQSAWQAMGMDDTLKGVVDAAVAAELSKFGYWDRVKQLWDEEAIGKVLDGAVNEAMDKFAPEYRSFLDRVTEGYSTSLGKLFQHYAQDLSATRVEAARSMPGLEGLRRNVLLPTLAGIGKDYEVPAVSAPVSIKEMVPAGVGAAILVVRKQLQKLLLNNLGRRLLGAAGRKVIFLVKGPAGWIIAVGLIGYDAYAIGKDIADLPERIRSEILGGMRRLYAVQAPEAAWSEGLKDEVRSSLGDVHARVTGDFDAVVRDLNTCPGYGQAVEPLDATARDEFAEKLYILHRRTKKSACRLADEVGSSLTRLGSQDLRCLETAIVGLGLERTGRWMALAPEKVCTLVEIPADQLVKFEPTKDDLSLLLWIAGLPERLRATVFNLDPETREWIRLQALQVQIDILSGRTVQQVREEMHKRRTPAVTSHGRGSWYDEVQETAVKILGPFVPEESIRKWLNLTAAGVAIFVVLCLIFLLKKIGLFRFVRWLFRGKKKTGGS